MSEDEARFKDPAETTSRMSEDEAKLKDPAETTSPNPYASTVQTMRETAKWLVTAVAAGAAALLAGTQLSSLGQLVEATSHVRLAIALMAGAAALYAAGRMLLATARVLTPEWDSFPSLLAEEAARNDTDDMVFINSNSWLLSDYDSLKAIDTAFQQAQDDVTRIRLRQIASNIVYAVQAERIRHQLNDAQKSLRRWGVVGAVGIILFGQPIHRVQKMARTPILNNRS